MPLIYNCQTRDKARSFACVPRRPLASVPRDSLPVFIRAVSGRTRFNGGNFRPRDPLIRAQRRRGAVITRDSFVVGAIEELEPVEGGLAGHYSEGIFVPWVSFLV